MQECGFHVKPLFGSVLAGLFRVFANQVTYVIAEKINEVDYIVNTPGRRKAQRLCHINMLKKYHQRPDEKTVDQEVTSTSICIAAKLRNESEARDSPPDMEYMVERGPKLRNSDFLKDLQNHKLSHLVPKEQDEMMQLVFQFVGLFPE